MMEETDAGTAIELAADGLPVDPVARAAALDEMINADVALMRTDIAAWQKDEQARKDHVKLLEMKQEIAEPVYMADAPMEEVERVHGLIEQCINERNELMRKDINGHHADEVGRKIYTQLLRHHESLSKRTGKRS
jgi:hypothetical protein